MPPLDLEVQVRHLNEQLGTQVHKKRCRTRVLLGHGQLFTVAWVISLSAWQRDPHASLSIRISPYLRLWLSCPQIMAIAVSVAQWVVCKSVPVEKAAGKLCGRGQTQLWSM